MDFDSKVSGRLEFLYGSEKKSRILNQLKELIAKYNFEVKEEPSPTNSWDEEDTILITYGDTVLPKNGQSNTLQPLEDFIVNHVGHVINTIHILPFFPFSSDEGFSVVNYREVREDLGEWEDIERLANDYKLMADLVINHTSRFSQWFENFQMGEEPGKDYFIEVDPTTDLSKVTRPRNSPLFTSVKTEDGLKYVWTTFSDDQIDVDFTNPDVLLEYIDIFLFYISKGIRLIRLDAVAYLWKEIGTTSIHLEETHEVIKLLRDIADHIDPQITLISETNVPFDKNISYFGNGDEAHMIYQFSLPPLLVHAILTENAQYLTDWAAELPDPQEGCTFFNFTASHDGIGIRPCEGLIPQEEFDYLVESTEERGGFVSYKKNADGSQSPYELNITYFDIFSELGEESADLQVKRYMCSQIIMLSLQGVPGIYFHNLTATHNYMDGVTETGEKRAINRKQWPKDELESELQKSSGTTYQVLDRYKELLQIRKQHPAFSPEAPQEVLDIAPHFFVLQRKSEEEEILCISNVSRDEQSIDRSELQSFVGDETYLKNLLRGKVQSIDPELQLEPFETVWLVENSEES